MKRRIVLLGPPASGKGTLADRLFDECGLPIVAPGALLRAEKMSGSEMGKQEAIEAERGHLIGDDTVNTLVRNWLTKQTGEAFVFDGYPRTVGQAGALQEMLHARGSKLDAVLLLEANPETLRDRMGSRAQCDKCGHIVGIGVHVPRLSAPCPRCGGGLARRADDTDETFTERLREYAAKTFPLIETYETAGLLHRLSTDCSSDQVFKTALQLLA